MCVSHLQSQKEPLFLLLAGFLLLNHVAPAHLNSGSIKQFSPFSKLTFNFACPCVYLSMFFLFLLLSKASFSAILEMANQDGGSLPKLSQSVRRPSGTDWPIMCHVRLASGKRITLSRLTSCRHCPVWRQLLCCQLTMKQQEESDEIALHLQLSVLRFPSGLVTLVPLLLSPPFRLASSLLNERCFH